MTGTAIAPAPSTPPRAAPVALDDLARRVTELWAVEPSVPLDRRSELLAQLAALEGRIDALVVRNDAGAGVHPSAVRSCAREVLWLREQWGDDELAA